MKPLTIKSFVFVLTAFFFLTAGCSKHGGDTAPNNPDVYVAGSEYNGATHSIAKLWKNGAPQALTDGTNYATANSVYVSGSNVYVTGYESNGNTYVAKTWRNGEVQILTDGSNNAYAQSVFVK